MIKYLYFLITNSLYCVDGDFSSEVCSHNRTVFEFNEKSILSGYLSYKEEVKMAKKISFSCDFFHGLLSLIKLSF